MKKKLQVSFQDRVFIDNEKHTLISMRDGVQRYLGSELGMEPADKYFYIYRAPETIAECAKNMEALPITEGHVSLDAYPSEVIGKILDARLIDVVEPRTNTTVKVQNAVNTNEGVALDKELSLGYFADLIECELYDFEQVDMVPHHLAIVEKGRCGDMCKFKDEETEMKKTINAAFLDVNGEVNMQQVLQLVADLPDAIKGMPLKQLQKLVPALQNAVEVGKTEIVQEGGEPIDPAEGGETDPPRQVSEEIEDEGGETDMKKAVTDALAMQKKEFDDKLAAQKKEFDDAVSTAAADLNKRFSGIVAKAREFLPDTYDFTDKSCEDVMRDTLATCGDEKFTNEELPVAFKVLKKPVDYKGFGDGKAGGLVESIGDKEL